MLAIAIGFASSAILIVSRDGMLSGVNIEATVRLARALRIPIIASGGITDLRDIDALCADYGGSAASSKED